MAISGETELWCAVIRLAVDHARGVGLGIIARHRRAEAVTEAQRWLLQDASLHMVAALAGIDGEALRRWAQAQPWAQELLAA